MGYKVVESFPRYDDRDALIGQDNVVKTHAYVTRDFAFKVAERFAIKAEQDGIDDVSYFVIDNTGKRVYPARYDAPTTYDAIPTYDNDEVPF